MKEEMKEKTLNKKLSKMKIFIFIFIIMGILFFMLSDLFSKTIITIAGITFIVLLIIFAFIVDRIERKTLKKPKLTDEEKKAKKEDKLSGIIGFPILIIFMLAPFFILEFPFKLISRAQTLFIKWANPGTITVDPEWLFIALFLLFAFIGFGAFFIMGILKIIYYKDWGGYKRRSEIYYGKFGKDLNIRGIAVSKGTIAWINKKWKIVFGLTAIIGLLLALWGLPYANYLTEDKICKSYPFFISEKCYSLNEIKEIHAIVYLLEDSGELREKEGGEYYYLFMNNGEYVKIKNKPEMAEMIIEKISIESKEAYNVASEERPTDRYYLIGENKARTVKGII